MNLFTRRRSEIMDPWDTRPPGLKRDVPYREPVLAGFLNLLAPGFGFIYLGQPIFVVGGILLFVVSCASAVIGVLFVNYAWVLFPMVLSVPLSILAHAAAEAANMLPSERPDTIYCPRCGIAHWYGCAYCGHCGEELPDISKDGSGTP